MNYYNEIDPHAAEWLRELIAQGSLPAGYVDERSIVDVRAEDLEGYRQCHFFAGIGAMARAVMDAGHADTPGLWTGSCPCQPFSAAGNNKGIEDERHLWPAFFRLIEACRPAVVIGEQVASAAAIGKVATKAGAAPVGQSTWIDHVFDDLEGARYACAADVRAAVSVGAPNIRLRLYFVACRLADASDTGLEGYGRSEEVGGAQGRQESPGHGAAHSEPDGTDPVNGSWAGADWLFCRDGKWRPVEPGLEPLVDGAATGVGSGGDPGVEECRRTKEARQMRLKGYGNAVNLPQATVFVAAALRACLPEAPDP